MNVQIDRSEQPACEPRVTSTRRIDVTDLDAKGVEEFVRHSIDTDAVSLEHRGSRTYLLIDR